MGHRLQKKNSAKQFSFEKTQWQFRFNHGGQLRKKRRGRKARPLSTREPIHVVFKADRSNQRWGYRSPKGYRICQIVIKQYAKRFFVKIEQLAICNDHIHMIVRLSRRSLGQHFFRVVAGQIAQRIEDAGGLVTDTQSIWKFRPFTRVIQGWKAYITAKDYVRLNEKEASGEIKYSKQRLRGLSAGEWEILWS